MTYSRYRRHLNNTYENDPIWSIIICAIKKTLRDVLFKQKIKLIGDVHSLRSVFLESRLQT